MLDVSASGYFEHQRRRSSLPSQPGGGRLGNEARLTHIRAIHAEVRGEYGWPRVCKELLARGIRVGEDRVQRLMQTQGITARSKCKFVVTTESRNDLPVAPNLLTRAFALAAPAQRVEPSERLPELTVTTRSLLPVGLSGGSGTN